jgi:flagellar hook-associated protein 3 FlgL
MVGITAKIAAAEIRRQQQLSKAITDGQTAISTGITLTRPSDNALAWVQVSDLARAQAQQAAWTANVKYATGRANTAESNLSEINNLLTRAQDLTISARNGALNDTGREAIVEELTTIRATVTELLNQKDFQGTPVFDDGQNILVPLSRGLNLAVVGTRQSVSEDIVIDGTTTSINGIFDTAISALQSGDDDAIANAVDKIQGGLDHIVVEQAKQGVRSDRLDTIAARLTDIDLDLDERRQALESTDLTQVIADVSARLLQLNAAQAAFARINQKTLFDLIS